MDIISQVRTKRREVYKFTSNNFSHGLFFLSMGVRFIDNFLGREQVALESDAKLLPGDKRRVDLIALPGAYIPQLSPEGFTRELYSAQPFSYSCTQEKNMGS